MLRFYRAEAGGCLQPSSLSPDEGEQLAIERPSDEGSAWTDRSTAIAGLIAAPTQRALRSLTGRSPRGCHRRVFPIAAIPDG
jgi:hypothetical protein